MAEHNDLGKEAEKEAVAYLLSKGYTILEKNWRYQKSEIDIIALYKEELVIVEVKARSSCDFINPEDAVTPLKRKRLIEAADYYVTNGDWDIYVRFDIISMLKETGKWKINHIEDAFDIFS